MSLTVLIIRHAEKPGEDWPGPGLTIDGVADKKSLVVRGWQRAGAWAALFGGLGGSDYPKPAVIYASDPDVSEVPESPEPSRRPYETVIPLADRLNPAPIRFPLGQEPQLVADILGRSGSVLISWEHRRITSALIPALLQRQALPGLPPAWDSKRFDIVLRFDRDAGGAWSFRQLFPRLLAGDSEVPM